LEGRFTNNKRREHKARATSNKQQATINQRLVQKIDEKESSQGSKSGKKTGRT
jgi:hypothetical protein